LRATRIVFGGIAMVFLALPCWAHDNGKSNIDPNSLANQSPNCNGAGGQGSSSAGTVNPNYTSTPNPGDANYADELRSELALQQAFLQQAEAALDEIQIELSLAQQVSQLEHQLEQGRLATEGQYPDATGSTFMNTTGATGRSRDILNAANVLDDDTASFSYTLKTEASGLQGQTSGFAQADQAQLPLAQQASSLANQLDQEANYNANQLQQLVSSAQQNFSMGQGSQAIAAQAQIAVNASTNVYSSGLDAPWDEQLRVDLGNGAAESYATTVNMVNSYQAQFNALSVVVTRAQAQIAQTQAQLDAATGQQTGQQTGNASGDQQTVASDSGGGCGGAASNPAPAVSSTASSQATAGAASSVANDSVAGGGNADAGTGT
jgi:hypothetical protein